MSNTKTVMSQAANTQGLPLDITDVFSTYLYTGNGSTQTITNGIDLAGEGGLVWLKSRSQAYEHQLHDSTASPVWWSLNSNNTAARSSESNSVNQLNSDGFVIGGGDMSVNGDDYVTWTFRKAPKFFDVVTYTGTGSVRTIAHNLGVAPGCIIIKETSAARNWYVYHRSTGNTKYLYLNLTDAAATSSLAFNNTDPTDAEFTVGTINGINNSGATYVAYLFAHNDGDGEFGPDGDQDIIKCGSYTGNGLNDGPEIDLGFEPQFLIVKDATSAGDWKMYDAMRGLNASGASDYFLEPNTSDAEDLGNYYAVSPTGFKLTDNTSFHNSSGNTYIYIAIRRGPLAPPESGTEVFAVQQSDGTSIPSFSAGFPIDAALLKATTLSNGSMRSRLTGTGLLETNSTGAEGSNSFTQWDYQDSWYEDNISSSYYSWMWKRAPNFFDVVAYTGDGVAGRTVSHNLGVAPEMMWVKSRTDTRAWTIYHSALGNESLVRFDTGAAVPNSSVYWNSTDPASDVFTCGSNTTINGSGRNYIAYLFATLAGVSKCGSYTGNGTSQTIDCGFTTGARFILIKRTDSTGDWYVWDTARGVVAGNDPHLSLNTTAAEVTSDDSIDPDNSGFIVNQVGATNINVSSAEYIFYAVA